MVRIRLLWVSAVGAWCRLFSRMRLWLRLGTRMILRRRRLCRLKIPSVLILTLLKKLFCLGSRRIVLGICKSGPLRCRIKVVVIL